MTVLSIVKRVAFASTLVLCLSQCSMVIGSFEDCEQTSDCWQLYDRNDLSCQEKQCVTHDLYSNCETIVGNTDSALTDDEVMTFGAIMAMSTPEGASNPRGKFAVRRSSLVMVILIKGAASMISRFEYVFVITRETVNVSQSWQSI